MAFALIGLAAQSLEASAADCCPVEAIIHFELEVVSLRGRIVFEREYGPPGYGESPDIDPVFFVPYLLLPCPIEVEPPNKTNPSEGRLVTTKVQLGGDREAKYYEPYLGHEIVAQGTLFSGVTGHHYASVVVEVTKIEFSEQLEKGD